MYKPGPDFRLTLHVQCKKLVFELVVIRRLDHMHEHHSGIKGPRNLGYVISIRIYFFPERVGIMLTLKCIFKCSRPSWSFSRVVLYRNVSPHLRPKPNQLLGEVADPYAIGLLRAHLFHVSSP